MICRLKMETLQSEMTTAAAAAEPFSDRMGKDTNRDIVANEEKIREGSAPPSYPSAAATTADVATVSPHYLKRYHGGPKVDKPLYLSNQPQYKPLIKTTLPVNLIHPFDLSHTGLTQGEFFADQLCTLAIN